MVLPTRVPICSSMATGIAVGMATNIPPHNLKEIIDATIGCNDPTTPHHERDLKWSQVRISRPRDSCYGRAGILADYFSGRATSCARAVATEENRKTARSHNRHGNSVPGQQVKAD